MAANERIRSTSTEVIQIYSASCDADERTTCFEDLDLHRESFEHKTLQCCEWLRCDLSGVIFSGCDLRGSDFRHSCLANTAFIGCLLEGCELPKDSSIRVLGADKPPQVICTRRRSSELVPRLKGVARWVRLTASMPIAKLLALALVFSQIAVVLALVIALWK